MNNDFKPLIREVGLRFPNMFLSTCNWFQAINKSDFFEYSGEHADEMETSLLLYLKPEFVLPLAEAGEGGERKNKIKAFEEGWVWAERRWSQISRDTGVGNPKSASKEKGEKYFKAVTERLANLFVELSNCKIDKLYE